MAPSGVVVIGVALVLRDAVHTRLGLWWSVAAVAVGAGLSAIFSPVSLVVASGTSFLVSELCDLAVYAPLRKRRLWAAVLASGVVGAIVDSSIFLYVAFGSMDHMTGQVIGKIAMSALAAAVIMAWGLAKDSPVQEVRQRVNETEKP